MNNIFKMDANNVFEAMEDMRENLGREEFLKSEICDYFKKRNYNEPGNLVILKLKYLYYQGIISFIENNGHKYYYIT